MTRHNVQRNHPRPVRQGGLFPNRWCPSFPRVVAQSSLCEGWLRVAPHLLARSFHSCKRITNLYITSAGCRKNIPSIIALLRVLQRDHARAANPTQAKPMILVTRGFDQTEHIQGRSRIPRTTRSRPKHTPRESSDDASQNDMIACLIIATPYALVITQHVAFSHLIPT